MAMQGEQFKTIRKVLGWTLAEMAEQLGMSETYVGQMERGQKPIERRTELAAQQLHNQCSRLMSNHEIEPLDTDIPIAEAQIIWDDAGVLDPAVKVVAHGKDDDRYSSSGGACNLDWQQADDVGRLLRLFALFVNLTVVDKLPADAVHRAFAVIPEYRRAMQAGWFEDGVLQ